MALLGGLLGNNSGSLAPSLVDVVNGLLDGGSSNTGAVGGTGGTSTSGLLNTGLLDGLVDVKLLSDRALLDLSLLDGGSKNGVASLSLLDPNGDGLIDIKLLNGNAGVSVLDPDGNGLVEAALVDLIAVNNGPVNGTPIGLPHGSANPAFYEKVLTGSNGADSFIVGNEATFVDGKLGIDTVSYGASSDGFRYNSDVDGVFIGKGGKVDFLKDVERVQFSDGTLILDTGQGEDAGIAYRLYEAALDRTPEAAGLKYWMDKLDAGQSITNVANGFIFSPEFMQKYGELSNSAFVGQLYENVLERQGEASGMDYYINRLDQGVTSRAEVLIGFSESPENVATVGATIAEGFFLMA